MNRYSYCLHKPHEYAEWDTISGELWRVDYKCKKRRYSIYIHETPRIMLIDGNYTEIVSKWLNVDKGL